MKDFFSEAGAKDLFYSLKVLNAKGNQITSNIANQDTPGYKSKKLDFTEVMQAYQSGLSTPHLYKTNSKHISPNSSLVDPSVYVRYQNNPSVRNDGNDVNLDYETSEYSGMSMMYMFLTEIVGSRFATIKEAIKSR